MQNIFLILIFLLTLLFFADDGPAQFVQAVGKAVEPLLHTQQQIPAQNHRETEVRGSAEKLFGIHGLCQHGKQLGNIFYSKPLAFSFVGNNIHFHNDLFFGTGERLNRRVILDVEIIGGNRYIC